MLYFCSSCHQQQMDGRFCEECGGELVLMQPRDVINPEKTEVDIPVHTGEVSHSSQPFHAPNSATQVQTESMFLIYRTNLVSLLKNPTQAFQAKEDDFVTGLINVGVYTVTFAIAFYLLAQSFLKSLVELFTMISTTNMEQELSQVVQVIIFGLIFPEQFMNLFQGDFIGSLMGGALPGMDVDFFDVFLRGLLIAGIFLVISIISIFIMMKVAKSQLSIKNLLAQYGGLLVPFALVNVVAMVLLLVGSISFASILLFLSVFYVAIILPAVVTLELTKSLSQNRIYLSLGASFLAMILSFFIISNYIRDYIKTIESIIEML